MAKTKPAPRTSAEKLRGLVNLKVGPHGYYTQRELGALLGISERTIRRFKNQPGYILAPETLARIRGRVSAADRQIKRVLDSGVALRSRIVTIHGKRKRIIEKVKGGQFKIPASRILQFPMVYPSKDGLEQTVSVNVKGWTTEQKIELARSAYKSGRFSAWYYRKAAPKGEGYVTGTLNMPGHYVSLSDLDEETQKTVSLFTTEGPFDLRRAAENFADISSRIGKDSDSGREVLVLNFVEKLTKRKKGKK